MKCILNILSLNTKTSNVNLTYNSYGKNITTLGSISSIAYPNERFWKYAEKYQNKVVIGVDAHKPYDYDRSRYDLAFQLIEKYHLNYISNFIINKR